jgi:hypothetical protein
VSWVPGKFPNILVGAGFASQIFIMMKYFEILKFFKNPGHKPEPKL